MTDPDLIRALDPVVRVFEEAAVPYYIGGSLASSVYGMARATIDVDIAAGIEMKHITVLLQRLQDKYYIDERMITDAIARGGSFNMIHLETSIKIDVFIQTEEIYSHTAMERRRADVFPEGQPAGTFFFCSAEDTVIHKIRWYEAGGRVSDRQWLDILGVLKVQGDSVDKDYLKHWCNELGVVDLLEKAFLEAGVAP